MLLSDSSFRFIFSFYFSLFFIFSFLSHISLMNKKIPINLPRLQVTDHNKIMIRFIFYLLSLLLYRCLEILSENLV